MPIFAIRDDDINAFTSVEMLRRVYLQDLDFIRPSLCLTPRAGEVYRQILLNELSIPSKQDKINFAKNILGKGGGLQHDWRCNEGIIPVLRALLDHGAEICLHGINHDATQFGFECESPAPGATDMAAMICEIEVELSTKVRVFSPPNNSINGDWLDVLRSNGLDLVTSVGVRPNECGWSFDSLLSMMRILPAHLSSSGTNRAWVTCQYRGVKAIQSYPISMFSKREEVLGVIGDAHTRGKNFVLAIHSYQFEEPNWLYDLFKDACHEAQKLGFKFGTLSNVLGL